MNDELSRLVDRLPGLIWTAGYDAHVDFVNQQWSDFTGLTASEAHGQGWRAAIHTDDLPLMDERWRLMVGSGALNEFRAASAALRRRISLVLAAYRAIDRRCRQRRQVVRHRHRYR